MIHVTGHNVGVDRCVVTATYRCTNVLYDITYMYVMYARLMLV